MVRFRIYTVAIGKPERHVRKVSHCGSKDHAPVSLLLLLVRPWCIWVLFFAHIPFVLNRAFSSTLAEGLQQHPLIFTTNRTDRMSLVWRLHPARPSHSGHSTFLLRSESPNGMCAKLRTVAASNNWVHTPRSLYYCLFGPHIYGCCSWRTFRL